MQPYIIKFYIATNCKKLKKNKCRTTTHQSRPFSVRTENRKNLTDVPTSHRFADSFAKIGNIEHCIHVYKLH